MKPLRFILLPGSGPSCARIVGLVLRLFNGETRITRPHLATQLGYSTRSLDNHIRQAKAMGLLVRTASGSLKATDQAAFAWAQWTNHGLSVVPVELRHVPKAAQRVWTRLKNQRKGFIPSIRSLQADLDLSRSTIKRSLKRLASLGLVVNIGVQAKQVKRRCLWLWGRIAVRHPVPASFYNPRTSEPPQQTIQSKAAVTQRSDPPPRELIYLDKRVQSLADLLPSTLAAIFA